METQAIVGILLLLLGMIIVLIKLSNKDTLDLTSKDESKLSEEGVHEPEFIKEVHKEVKKTRKSRSKKQAPTCEIEEVKEVAEPKIIRKVNKSKKS